MTRRLRDAVLLNVLLVNVWNLSLLAARFVSACRRYRGIGPVDPSLVARLCRELCD